MSDQDTASCGGPQFVNRGGLPTIPIVPGRLPAVVDAAEMALIGANAEIYQRGTVLVRPVAVPISIEGDRVVHVCRLEAVGDYGLVEALTRAAEWQRWVAGEKKPRVIDCPLVVAKTYRARVGQWRVPVLTGIVNCPTLRQDGSVLEGPGYDPATGLLFDPLGMEFPAVPARPSREDAARALGVLHELLSGFPFVGPADRAVALSAILTALVRRTLDAAPLHAFTAPAAGTGKSLLVDIASMIANGCEAAVMEEGDEQELPKRLGAAFMAGDPLVSIDNCERALGGGFLCQALTQEFLNIRVLGQSENRLVPCDTFVCATGNNLRIVGDMTRRAILCTLDAGMERPELRAFTSNPVAVVKGARGRFVQAALTVLRAYHVAGRPGTLSPTGSFEDWSRLVRGALVWLGEGDPWASSETIRGADPRLEATTAVLSQWVTVIGDERVTTRELIDRATQRVSFGILGRDEYVHPDFREALLGVAGKGGAINGRRLGTWLGGVAGRVVGGRKLVAAGVVHGQRMWRVAEA